MIRFILLADYAYEGYATFAAAGDDDDPLPSYATRGEAEAEARRAGLISPKGRHNNATILAVRMA